MRRQLTIDRAIRRNLFRAHCALVVVQDLLLQQLSVLVAAPVVRHRRLRRVVARRRPRR